MEDDEDEDRSPVVRVEVEMLEASASLVDGNVVASGWSDPTALADAIGVA